MPVTVERRLSKNFQLGAAAYDCLTVESRICCTPDRSSLFLATERSLDSVREGALQSTRRRNRTELGSPSRRRAPAAKLAVPTRSAIVCPRLHRLDRPRSLLVGPATSERESRPDPSLGWLTEKNSTHRRCSFRRVKCNREYPCDRCGISALTWFVVLVLSIS